MKVLITGGSGFIGGELCRRLAAHGHALTVLSRSPARARSKLPEGTRVVASLDDIGDDEAIDGIVNLAGENLFTRRWSESRKRTLMASRLDTTRELVALCRRLDTTPSVMVSGSASPASPS